MTGRDGPENPTRRRFLAAAGVGLAGSVAGCGYRPGGGDLAWESSLGGGGLLRDGDRWFLPASDRLFVVWNRSGRTFDFGTETWRDVENAAVTALDSAGDSRLEAETERQAAGVPAVTETSVVVPVEGGRVTAIDREAAAFDRDERAVDGGADEATERDATRWLSAVGAADADGSSEGDGAAESDGTTDDDRSSESDGATDDDRAASVDAVRASDRLVAAVRRDDVIVLDAATGDRAFGLAAAWPDASDPGPGSVAPDRVAVDGEDVWVAVSGADGESGSEDGPVLARFDRTGERRVARALSSGVDWLAVVDGRVVVGDERADSVSGFDRDLDRRFALDAPTPGERPPIVDGDSSGEALGSRVYLRRGETVRALDVAAGEVAWERDDLPAARGFAADGRGIYAVDRRTSRNGGRRTGPTVVAVGADGADRWSAPLPEGVRVTELFAVGGRLLVVDGDDLYGLRAAPGERWSLLG
ncbi:hypothetical protein [Halorubrum kocurii]|uniref:Pyrrolo-quinoline quinone n=1 Tax=Halorubrum kocurii JCM 14978 TaxID=1230456 RepID=M0NIJ1_9EURY|nr:hypothetical protein [Halorubrum kocurii]EMA56909.1 hypothetical protein C468_17174 [Halorubrum kocurii JCM 14978]